MRFADFFTVDFFFVAFVDDFLSAFFGLFLVTAFFSAAAFLADDLLLPAAFRSGLDERLGGLSRTGDSVADERLCAFVSCLRHINDFTRLVLDDILCRGYEALVRHIRSPNLGLFIA